MRMGMVGLGRMGGSMSVRLLAEGHEVVGYDPLPEARARVEQAGGKVTSSLEELVQDLEPPRVVWVMAPAGDITERVVSSAAASMSKGDVIVEGGNSNWKESIALAGRLKKERGISLLDCGTSGGVWGLANGYCLVVGGEREAFERAEPLFRALAPADGYAHVGPSGAGHFVKMVHNAIEYGVMASYAEGFEILRRSGLELNLTTISETWRHGSVIRSWLLDLIAQALEKDPDLESVRGYVEDSGEGRWAVQAAIEEDVPAPFTALALFSRFASRQDESFAAKVVAALRREFGGHAVRSAVSPEARPGGEL